MAPTAALGRAGRFIEHHAFLLTPMPARVDGITADIATEQARIDVRWALLSDEQAQFVHLGPDLYAARANPERKVRQHVRGRQGFGYDVTLNPAA